MGDDVYLTEASCSSIARARKRLAERLGELGRERTAELQSRRERLARTQSRIAGLVRVIADGDRSEAVVSALYDLEAQGKAEEAAIAEIERQTNLPIRFPTPAEVEQLAFDLEHRLARDPAAGREWLRRILKDEKLLLELRPDGVYLAKGDLLPLMLVAQKETAALVATRRRYPGVVAGA